MALPSDLSNRTVEILRDVKRLAREYYEVTGRPLGITGEVAEYEAARLLGVELSPVRQSGYDAIRRQRGRRERVQIKGRVLAAGATRSQRIGGIRLDREWDALLLVLLDERFEATAIYEADRASVENALTVPGSKARNVRGQLTVSKFKSIGKKIWLE
jgi:hypothetical protein